MLLRILELFGRPCDGNRYLFNGDFVDRGPWSVEVVFTLLSHKLLYPDQFYLVRGNHETEEINKIYGFYNEVLDKYDEQMFQLFQGRISFIGRWKLSHLCFLFSHSQGETFLPSAHATCLSPDPAGGV